MTLNIVSSFNGVSDPDAAAYIEAVEAADGELLEFAVGKAINDFVLGCKADGIWNAIKASCILAGARTLNGALVPLAGTAPTNFNFVSGDYDRKAGLVGDGSTKYLDSNRANNADPQNSCHLAVWKSDLTSGVNPYFIGVGLGGFTVASAIGQNGMYSNSSAVFANNLINDESSASGLHGFSRASGGLVSYKRPGALVKSSATTSTSPPALNHFVFNISVDGSPSSTRYSSSRLAFYSIGESLDLALLDARVTDLITAFGAAIP